MKKKYWISKYALSKGIYEIEAEVSPHNPQVIRFPTYGKFPGYFYKPNWHESELEARKQARLEVQKKISQMDKLREKYKKLLETF